jgi:hypothetical protein
VDGVAAEPDVRIGRGMRARVERADRRRTVHARCVAWLIHDGRIASYVHVTSTYVHVGILQFDAEKIELMGELGHRSAHGLPFAW